ncbi:uncharacterized protein [Macaca nemestrina]|uniref:uncharacterized protein isoform X1 n=1 Tax=Macaca nemestrina TaxID=9545 RepID=UPI0039B8985F
MLLKSSILMLNLFAANVGANFALTVEKTVMILLNVRQWLKKWIKKCDDDSETSNWIAANTKECPKCHVTIEKDGGCNHMVCRNQNCKAEFCWVCLGPWEPHGSAWYNCNRYNEDDAKAARDAQENPATITRILLSHFNWDQEKLMERYFDGNLEKLFAECHVINPSKKSRTRQMNTRSSAQDMPCQICCLNYPNSYFTGLECGHKFCMQCWSEYLTTKIMEDGMGQTISCPAHGCDILVDDNTVMYFDGNLEKLFAECHVINPSKKSRTRQMNTRSSAQDMPCQICCLNYPNSNPATITRILLSHFNWDQEKLMERYFDGNLEKLFAECHVINPS